MKWAQENEMQRKSKPNSFVMSARRLNPKGYSFKDNKLTVAHPEFGLNELDAKTIQSEGEVVAMIATRLSSCCYYDYYDYYYLSL